MSLDTLRAAMAKMQQGVDILVSLSVPEPFDDLIRQFTASWALLQINLNQKIAIGDVSGATNLVIWYWQQISRLTRLLRPEAIAGRVGADVYNLLVDIGKKIKTIVDTLWWWGIGIGGAMITGSALLAYWLHKQGKLIPLIDKASNAIPHVRAAKIAAKGLGSGPTECRFAVSKTKAGLFKFDLFPVTEDGWRKALDGARESKSSVLLSCPEGAIRMVKCGSTTCVPTR